MRAFFFASRNRQEGAWRMCVRPPRVRRPYPRRWGSLGNSPPIIRSGCALSSRVEEAPLVGRINGDLMRKLLFGLVLIPVLLALQGLACAELPATGPRIGIHYFTWFVDEKLTQLG